MGPCISADRYRALCEVGTHPVPGLAPGHYSGSGKPVVGHIVQIGGIVMTATELGFAVAMAGTFAIAKIDIPKEQKQNLLNESINLIRSLGSITILNYEAELSSLYINKIGSRSIQ